MITHIAEISPRGDHNFGSTKMASVPGFLRHGAIENFTQPKAMKSTIWIIYVKGCFNTPLEHTPKPLPKG